MFTAITVLHIIVSIIIVIAVLLQVGKGASIGSTFGGGASSQTLFGSAGPATLLAKVTYIGVAIFMLTSLYLTYSASKSKATSIMSDVPAVTAPADAKKEEAKKPEPEAPKTAPAVPIEPAAPAAPKAPAK